MSNVRILADGKFWNTMANFEIADGHFRKWKKYGDMQNCLHFFQISSRFPLIENLLVMNFARILIFSDALENAEKRCNFSKFLDFNFDKIFKSIYSSNDLIFKILLQFSI